MKYVYVVRDGDRYIGGIFSNEESAIALAKRLTDDDLQRELDPDIYQVYTVEDFLLQEG